MSSTYSISTGRSGLPISSLPACPVPKGTNVKRNGKSAAWCSKYDSRLPMRLCFFTMPAHLGEVRKLHKTSTNDRATPCDLWSIFGFGLAWRREATHKLLIPLALSRDLQRSGSSTEFVLELVIDIAVIRLGKA